MMSVDEILEEQLDAAVYENTLGVTGLAQKVRGWIEEDTGNEPPPIQRVRGCLYYYGLTREAHALEVRGPRGSLIAQVVTSLDQDSLQHARQQGGRIVAVREMPTRRLMRALRRDGPAELVDRVEASEAMG